MARELWGLLYTPSGVTQVYKRFNEEIIANNDQFVRDALKYKKFSKKLEMDSQKLDCPNTNYLNTLRTALVASNTASSTFVCHVKRKFESIPNPAEAYIKSLCVGNSRFLPVWVLALKRKDYQFFENNIKGSNTNFQVQQDIKISTGKVLKSGGTPIDLALLLEFETNDMCQLINSLNLDEIDFKL